MKPYNEVKYIVCTRGVKFNIQKTESDSVMFSIDRYNKLTYLLSYDTFIEWIYENINNLIRDDYFDISKINSINNNRGC
jgi:hypothetical protein